MGFFKRVETHIRLNARQSFKPKKKVVSIAKIYKDSIQQQAHKIYCHFRIATQTKVEVNMTFTIVERVTKDLT